MKILAYAVSGLVALSLAVACALWGGFAASILISIIRNSPTLPRNHFFLTRSKKHPNFHKTYNFHPNQIYYQHYLEHSVRF
jgi:hypothetical protein